MKFYLGTHVISWLGRTEVPLFMSRRVLMKQKSWPVRINEATWALDSGSFTEVVRFGGWKVPAKEYAQQVAEYEESIGLLDWAAPQDWMCEPNAIAATGLSVEKHQQKTIDNFLELASIGGPFIPVVQGWTARDYYRHVKMYERAGIRLEKAPLVGVGSVCRRQNTNEARAIFTVLRAMGLKMHGFGVKVSGLRKYHHLLKSADSMAWSYAARKRQLRLPGCPHARCNNCLTWALKWKKEELGWE